MRKHDLLKVLQAILPWGFATKTHFVRTVDCLRMSESLGSSAFLASFPVKKKQQFSYVSKTETSAVSALFLHVLISGVFCIHLLFKDLMERLHLIFLFRVLYPKHLLHMLPWK